MGLIWQVDHRTIYHVFEETVDFLIKHVRFKEFSVSSIGFEVLIKGIAH